MKKLRWAILALSVVLCVVIFFSWDKIAASKNNESVENNAIGSETYVSGENYFESARYSRDQVRSETVSALNEILNNEKTEEQLEELKNEHFKKIELSDAIFVVNKNQYIGESTKLEIEYAMKLKKEIMYLEQF